MQKTILSLMAGAVFGFASMGAQADFVGVYAGIDAAFVKSDTENSAPNEDTKVAGTYSLAFEHPVPFVPNAKIRYSKYETTDWEDIGPAVIHGELEFETLDLLAYYEVLDNVVSIDVGAGAKKINSEISVVGKSKFNSMQISLSEKYDDTIPGLYAAAGGKLPLTGLSAKAEVFVGKNSNADFTDYNAEIKYNFVETLLVNVGAKVGYRNLKVNVDDPADVDELSAKGPYIGLEVHF